MKKLNAIAESINILKNLADKDKIQVEEKADSIRIHNREAIL